MNLSDQEYVERCRNGNKDDFRFLVERYQGPVFAFVASRLNDRTLAREVAEEALVRAFFALDKLRKPEAFHAWVLGIAGRVALEFQRAPHRRHEVAASPDARSSDSQADVAVDDDSRLDEAIAALPEMPRQLILLRYFELLSCQEIAERLRMPLGTVTKTLSRAYTTLRDSLTAQDADQTPTRLSAS